MVELQVPTGRMSMDGSIHSPWIDVFRVKDMQDYDTSDEIDSVLHEGEITFKNAKELMLQVARENICKFCSNGTPILKSSVHSF